MELHWSPRATSDFIFITQYIRQDSDDAALRVARTIYEKVQKLRNFPRMGRLGRVVGTRELALPPLPFVVVYRIQDTTIEISRVLHGAQQWP